jgi:IS30 family transposase
MRVSHDRIYRSLFFQACEVMKKELVAHLRRVGTMRSSRSASSQARDDIIDAFSIYDRPAEITHKNNAIKVISSKVAISPLLIHWSNATPGSSNLSKHGKDTHSIIGALIREAHRLAKHLLFTLTWDRGMELASHKTFTFAIEMKVYFADPKGRGNPDQTLIQMGYWNNTSSRAVICQVTAKTNSM